MQGKVNLRSGVLWIIFGASIMLSSLHLAQANSGGWKGMQEKLKIIKEFQILDLSPDRAAALLALNQKYDQERQGLLATLKQCRQDLQAALAASAPNEAQIKDLVQAANAAQDKLLISIQHERNEAMALMTPIQQGRFFMILDNWFQKMVRKS